MLDRIRDIDSVSRDAGALEYASQKLARGPNEWLSGQIFRIAWLLTDEHQ